MRTIIHFTFIFFLCCISSVSAENIKVLEGKELTHIISQNKGKVIYINMFATWCPSCKQEMPNIISARNNYPEDSVLFIGISLDENQQHLQNYVKESRINFPVYIAGSTVPSMFRTTAIPQNIIYNKKGELVVNEAGGISEETLNEMISKYNKK